MKDFSIKSKAAVQRMFPSLKGIEVVDKEAEAAFFVEWDKGIDEKEVNPNYYVTQANFKNQYK